MDTVFLHFYTKECSFFPITRITFGESTLSKIMIQIPESCTQSKRNHRSFFAAQRGILVAIKAGQFKTEIIFWIYNE
jgi:hypothetical protein